MTYAILSMIFAGVTSILAKYGLQNISADAGLSIRTFVIFVITLVLSFLLLKVGVRDLVTQKIRGGKRGG